MKVIDSSFLDELSAEAAASPRKRKNRNLHPSDDFCCHRLFNALEPGTYIMPHRHLDPLKDETMVMVRGAMGIVKFDGDGQVLGKALLRPGGTVAVDISHGTFHTCVSLEPGTIFFESKAGPYAPLTDAEKAPWAPAEGDTVAAAAYLEGLTELFR